ncbi:hypothetical protein LTR84_000870 [Exophiala bonariae]|uniref:DUF7703 domain-containing protein n=1 Tax=Exophiala bonariae TaxID=1690606 RepID=A0AAV9NSD2_9EURO|nr:hypothetical protein LTR84_000870 [Exophiala bonariae]
MSISTTHTQGFSPTVGWDAEAIIVVVCVTLSFYNCVELLVLVLTSFRQWRGLYFFSLVIASIGVIPYCLGFLLEYFHLLVFWASMLFSSIGWTMLITGQAFVLYSRLGLILTDAKILKGVKWMIIIDAIVFHCGTTIIQYGTAYGSHKASFTHALFYMEKIQMTGFTVQEFIISGIYLWKTVQLLRMIQREGTRRVMWELLTINIVIILMDIALLAMEYKALRAMERAFKSVIYSVKLKLEFAVLGRLVDLVQSSQRTLSNALADVESFVDTSISRSDTQASAPMTARRKSETVPDWMAKLEGETSHVEQAQVAPHSSTANGKRSPFITRPRDFDECSI